MQNENCYAQIKEVARLKKTLEIKRILNQDKDACHKFFTTFNYCMSLMRNNFKEILTKSYFDVDYKFWWVDKYCQSSFYRLRAKAVYSFMNLFNTIYENFSHFYHNIVSDSK